ncbi:hypothetical protein BU25DRAFT_463660 [Macroventuria anomochaeta]|uniref:Uncharacterized protein n=1 Tax=Macroventuria anomochaeta TaxID=301207 RepID=A0ACB6RKD9_9PLEO|nr:uncharacterized protein BU25DRAFT_463660 [Macroventuria anomochaeta]KAF2621429.1 hypothetical protein BU25DRAFT_463660 [Macroventuria anomochaeta]
MLEVADQDAAEDAPEVAVTLEAGNDDALAEIIAEDCGTDCENSPVVALDWDGDEVHDATDEVVPLEAWDDCTIEEVAADDCSEDVRLLEDASAELDAQAEVVPVAVVEAEAEDEEVPEVLEGAGEAVEATSEELEVQTADEPRDDVASEVACEEDWLADDELDDTDAVLEAAEEAHAELPEDEEELLVEASCEVATLDDGTVELTSEAVTIVAEEDGEDCCVCDDTGEGTTTTGGAPVEAASDEVADDAPELAGGMLEVGVTAKDQA